MSFNSKIPEKIYLLFGKLVIIQDFTEQSKSQIKINQLRKCLRDAMQFAIKWFTETPTGGNKAKMDRKYATTKRQDKILILLIIIESLLEIPEKLFLSSL